MDEFFEWCAFYVMWLFFIWYLPWWVGTGDYNFLSTMESGPYAVGCYIHWFIASFIMLAAVVAGSRGGK